MEEGNGYKLRITLAWRIEGKKGLERGREKAETAFEISTQQVPELQLLVPAPAHRSFCNTSNSTLSS